LLITGTKVSIYFTFITHDLQSGQTTINIYLNMLKETLSYVKAFLFMDSYFNQHHHNL